MIYAYALYKVEGGWGYRIMQDGVTFIDQPFRPHEAGFNPMTKDEAERFAREQIVSLEAE